jgi:hypothetical protein
MAGFQTWCALYVRFSKENYSLENYLPDFKTGKIVPVLRPGEGGCADPVYEDAELERVGEGPPGRNKERQLAPDTGGDRT